MEDVVLPVADRTGLDIVALCTLPHPARAVAVERVCRVLVVLDAGVPERSEPEVRRDLRGGEVPCRQKPLHAVHLVEGKDAAMPVARDDADGDRPFGGVAAEVVAGHVAHRLDPLVRDVDLALGEIGGPVRDMRRAKRRIVRQRSVLFRRGRHGRQLAGEVVRVRHVPRKSPGLSRRKAHLARQLGVAADDPHVARRAVRRAHHDRLVRDEPRVCGHLPRRRRRVRRPAADNPLRAGTLEHHAHRDLARSVLRRHRLLHRDQVARARDEHLAFKAHAAGMFGGYDG